MGTDISVMLAFAGVVVVIFLVGRLFMWPLAMLVKLVLNSLAGGLVIVLINVVGAGFGWMLPLNVVNAVIVGVLGIPGVILLAVLGL